MHLWDSGDDLVAAAVLSATWKCTTTYRDLDVFFCLPPHASTTDDPRSLTNDRCTAPRLCGEQHGPADSIRRSPGMKADGRRLSRSLP